MKCVFQEPEQTQAKTNQNNLIMCWPEELYEQVWNKEDLEEEVQETRRDEKRREEKRGFQSPFIDASEDLMYNNNNRHH